VLRGGTISGAAHVVALHARLGHEARAEKPLEPSHDPILVLSMAGR